MRLKYLVLAAALAPAMASAQTALTTTNYTQNFDGLASTGGTSSTLPAGVAILETGSNANNTYAVGTGSDNAGNTYSFGLAGSTDRALGSIASGSLETVFGLLFTNGLGSTITGFNFSYTGEQWRAGSSTNDRLVFEYSTNATSLTTGTWNTLSSLDFLPTVTSGTTALNGNLAANQRDLSAVISGLSIASGANFGFRWTNLDSTGADHGLAIDDVRIVSTLQNSAVPEPATWAMMMLGFGAMGFAMRRRPAANARIRFA